MDASKFFDVRIHPPKKGQVLASFRSQAEFIGGPQKLDIIKLLKSDKAFQAVQVMKKIHGVIEPDCYRVCREMATDLLTMTDKEVEDKVYHMVVNYMYYTERENVPTDDPRWELLSLLTWDAERNTFISKINI